MRVVYTRFVVCVYLCIFTYKRFWRLDVNAAVNQFFWSPMTDDTKADGTQHNEYRKRAIDEHDDPLLKTAELLSILEWNWHIKTVSKAPPHHHIDSRAYDCMNIKNKYESPRGKRWGRRQTFSRRPFKMDFYWNAMAVSCFNSGFSHRTWIYITARTRWQWRAYCFAVDFLIQTLNFS